MCISESMCIEYGAHISLPHIQWRCFFCTIVKQNTSLPSQAKKYGRDLRKGGGLRHLSGSHDSIIYALRAGHAEARRRQPYAGNGNYMIHTTDYLHSQECFHPFVSAEVRMTRAIRWSSGTSRWPLPPPLFSDVTWRLLR